MSELRAAVVAVDQSRVRLAAAGRALGEQWRDQHARMFEREFVTPIDVATARMSAALHDADKAVVGILADLRALGGDC